VNKVSFGPASWIGLIGAIAAAVAPVFGSLPVTWGATVAAVLAAITVIGRQVQAVMNTACGVEGHVVDILVDDLPTEPTDAPE
jgi:hypothetical protein